MAKKAAPAPRKCGSCAGTGQVSVPRRDVPDLLEKQACTVCGGSGQVSG